MGFKKAAIFSFIVNHLGSSFHRLATVCRNNMKLHLFLPCSNVLVLPISATLLIALCIAGCSSKAAFNPNKKYGPDELREDFTVARRSYEKIHPSLYWYTSKDSMDTYFDKAYQQLTDSLTELQFRNRMAYVIAKIKCGHTSIRFSEAYNNWAEKAGPGVTFPFAVKTWGGDSMVITRNAFRKDSLLTAGTVLLSVNGKNVPQLLAGMCNLISTDGNSMNFKYQLISGNFPAWYRYAFGLQREYKVQYVAANGSVQTKVLGNYNPRADTADRPPHPPLQAPPSRKKKKENALLLSRNLVIDSSGQMAVMTLNTFSKAKLKRFFRQSFRTLKQKNIPNLVIELRNNGGGSIGNSNRLTRYITDHSFKVADTCAAVSFKYPYPNKVKSGFWYKVEHWLVSPFRQKDGRYHFKQLERKVFSPYKKNHYNGHVFIVTGGYTFSASTLFINPLKGQKNVTVVGEETGGGAYGNTAVNLPEIELPNTHLRVRLPLYRLVINKNVPHDGHGIQPDIFVPPTSFHLRYGIDPKMDTIRKIIFKKENIAGAIL
jgi:hypothetical protein